MSEIDELEQSLRDLINAPRRHTYLRSDEHRFSQLCSALDVVGDTEAALDAYLNSNPGKPSIGELYLRTYGVLQVLIVQQDAVQHIAESLSLDYAPPNGLPEIREIRNDAVGHPSRRGRAPGRAFNHISRPTLSQNGFDLLTFHSGSPPEHRSIDLLSLVERQRQLVAAALREFVNSEVRREAEHRQAFRSIHLASAFPATLGYTLEKLAEEIAGSRALGIGPSLLGGVRDAISEFQQGLIARGELPAIEDAFAYHAHPARHAVDRLQQFFTQDPPASTTREDAQTFLFRLRHELDALRELAREIDQTYSSDPSACPHAAQ